MSLTAIFCRLRKWLGYYFEHLWARIIWKSVIIQASFRFGLAIVPVLMSQAWCQPLTVRCFGPSRLSLVVTGKVSVNSVNSYSDSCSFLFCHDHGAAVKKKQSIGSESSATSLPPPPVCCCAFRPPSGGSEGAALPMPTRKDTKSSKFLGWSTCGAMEAVDDGCTSLAPSHHLGYTGITRLIAVRRSSTIQLDSRSCSLPSYGSSKTRVLVGSNWSADGIVVSMSIDCPYNMFHMFFHVYIYICIAIYNLHIN
jgi:hypothetical protein